MRKKLLVFLFTCTSLFAFAHNELVGTFVFTPLGDCSLLLTATVEKKHLTHALKSEGSCALRDMMKVCGNQYLTDNFQVSIDGEQVCLAEEEMLIGKDYVTLTYTIDLQDNQIEEIKVQGDYMFSYNDHSILRVVFDCQGPTRSFNIKNSRRSITAKF